MASTNTLLSQQTTLSLVHTVKLTAMITVPISGRMLSSGISVVAFASVYSEKSRLKKLIMIIGERAKRARHSQVCSIENRGYIYVICYNWRASEASETLSGLFN